MLIKKRHKTKEIKIKNLAIGGNNPIIVQSMCNIKTENTRKLLNQIQRLENAGCEIIRVSVKDENDANALKKITACIKTPIVADIHFDYKLALKSIDAGVAKLRINPGNIGALWKVKEVVKSAKINKVPIRIGVNYGSLEKELVKKIENKKMTVAAAMVESARKEIKYFEKLNFTDIVVSLKTSDIQQTIESYMEFVKHFNYPLHIGITEAGTIKSGLIKSAIGIGYLLMQGIGDTIRVSLTADPVEEVYAAYNILSCLKLRSDLPELVSCPTCGRTEIDLINLANRVEKILYSIKKPIKVAVMGCVVNGPGEARHADIGITGGKGVGLLFKKGEIIKKVKDTEIFDELIKELEQYK
ncbi:MAG TPA: flavodoxin-dependent (E)-4-hydroxy-3-methylbut-2-enyl-diphosphate synthase [bacterium]|nr:flavodoxin-dependent (E)-4-hydroxy-3-methylbut-2-enyl-diphosphate synthase [bacterium]